MTTVSRLHVRLTRAFWSQVKGSCHHAQPPETSSLDLDRSGGVAGRVMPAEMPSELCPPPPSMSQLAVGAANGLGSLFNIQVAFSRPPLPCMIVVALVWRV